jgi:hypothetical protein
LTSGAKFASIRNSGEADCSTGPVLDSRKEEP